MNSGKHTEVCRNEVVLSWFASPVEARGMGRRAEGKQVRSQPSNYVMNELWQM